MSPSAMDSKQPIKNSGESSFPLEELSWTITKHASVVSQYLEAEGLPQPSSESHGPSVVVPNGAPEYIRKAQQQLISASLELFQLAIGPSEFVPHLATGFQYVSCVSWLCQYNIFHLVPLEGGISYSDLAAAAQVPKKRLRNIIRMAMTTSLFREQTDGKHVGHSATSALIAQNGDVHAWASYICDNTAPMALKLGEAHKRWGPGTVSKHETAYNIAFNTDLPFFDHLGRSESRMGQFAGYMKNVRSSKGIDLQHLVDGYTWADLPDGGVVVDVGGSTGSAAIRLAQDFSHLNFVVQDLPANAESGREAATKTLPMEISSRITFQGHDFTQPQPVIGADVYLLRMILHDWPDIEAIKILKNIVFAMSNKPSSRLLIMDTVLPTPGSVPVSIERIVRVRDLTMMQAFNSNERDIDDWKDLLGVTDPRLELTHVVQPFGSDMSVLEVQLGSAAGK